MADLNEREEIRRVTQLLQEAWAKAEPTHGVTLYPVSYVATFCDMAKAVVADNAQIREENARLNTRIQELLVTIRKLSAEVPYPEEAGKTGVLLAEIGSLKASIAEYDRILREAWVGSESANGDVMSTPGCDCCCLDCCVHR